MVHCIREESLSLGKSKSEGDLERLVSEAGGSCQEGITTFCEQLLRKARRPGDWLLDFLMESGRPQVIASWLFQDPILLERQGRWRLAKLAPYFTEHKHHLEAVRVYRYQVEKILVGKRSGIYHLAVQWLREMEAIQAQVTDWGEIATPDAYMADIRERHDKKRLFWKYYAEPV